MYSNDDQGRVYQNCKFHISHYSEYVFSSSLSIYFTLIAAFLYNCWFLFIIIMELRCKYAPIVTRIQCKITDAQVTVKACGPLVFSSGEWCGPSSSSCSLLEVYLRNVNLLYTQDYEYMILHVVRSHAFGQNMLLVKYQICNLQGCKITCLNN